MSHALVTGGAGFIGSHLVERLLADGWRVTALDCFDDFYDSEMKRANTKRALKHEDYQLIEADIRDESAMSAALARDVDVIVHLAARAGVRPSIADPLLYQDVNVRGTGVLLEAARAANVGRIVFASSSSVYGNNDKVPFAEDDNVDFPISPYAATKKAGELLCHTYHHLYGINIFCTRLFTVYGPRQRPDLAIHKFARLIEAGQPIPVFGDGTSRRDYTFVGDIVDGLVAAIEKCSGYEIINLGNSSPISLTDLIGEIETAVGKKANIERKPEQAGDVRQTYADIAKASRLLGYSPSTSLALGLTQFVEWLRR